jgi:hypothetical protein
MFKQTLFITALLSIIVLYACQKKEESVAPQWRSRVGERIYNRMQQANLITVYVIKPALKIDPKEMPEVIGSPIVLNEKEQAALRQLLINDESYDFAYNKRALFIPTVLIKYGDGAFEDSIYINLKANQIKFYDQERPILLDFDHAEPRFKQFFQSIGVE